MTMVAVKARPHRPAIERENIRLVGAAGAPEAGPQPNL